jgi:hypothetical protein
MFIIDLGQVYDSNFLVLALCFLLAIVVVYVLPRIAHKKRREKFVSRPIIDDDVFFLTHYSDDILFQEIARKIHHALAKEIKKINVTQILPTDRLDDILRIDTWWCATPWDRIRTIGCVEELVTDHISGEYLEVTLDNLIWDQKNSVRDLIEKVVLIISKGDRDETSKQILPVDNRHQ